MEPATPPDSKGDIESVGSFSPLQIPVSSGEMDAEMTTPRQENAASDMHSVDSSDVADAPRDHVEQRLSRVRAILKEMLVSDAWEDRDQSGQRRKLEELRACVLDDASLQGLQQLPKRMCAYEFKPGDIAWNCKVCQVDETCVMCNECFISSDHENHEVFFYYTHSGGCCDCGDTEAWASDGFCTHHRGAHDADPLDYIPHEIVDTARACLGEVLSLVLRTITEARRLAVVTVADVERVRAALSSEPPENRYTVFIHHNEMPSQGEFATAITRALPSISYQTMKIVGEAAIHKLSVVRSRATRDEALEIVEGMRRHGVVTSIVSSDYKAKTPVVSTLLQWLVSMANLSDGLCRLICEQLVAHSFDGSLSPAVTTASTLNGDFPVLCAVILADSFLPKHGSDALHSLLMSLLADPIFKKAFAVAFTQCYRQLFREFFLGVGSSSVTILTFSVQFFNRASFVKLLVGDHQLLEVLVASVLETLRRKPRAIQLLASATAPAIDETQDESVSLHQVLEFLHSSQQPQTGLSHAAVSLWDLLAVGIQRGIANGSTNLAGVNLAALETEARAAGYTIQHDASANSVFLSLPPDTELPGRYDLDISAAPFAHRRYMSGLLDLRYALQIEGTSELFVLEQNGVRLADFLLYLSYIQGVCPEVRRFGDHVELESRAWVVTVEFVSTASDVYTWIISNVFKHIANTQRPHLLEALITKLTQTMMEAYVFWLASAGKYFPPLDAISINQPLQANPVTAAISCHFPLHRTFAQLIRTLCDSPRGLDVFYHLMHGDAGAQRPWIHASDHPIGFWHRVNLVEPVLQAIVWDAEVHSGLWVRNGLSVLNHSMNYGEPPFCLRFRDLDLLLVQFGVQLLGIDWMVNSVVNRFGVEQWYDITNTDLRDSELMVSECMTLLCQFASELPPRIAATGDPLRCLLPFLRREIIQRLIVGPCAHSDLAKITTEFFLTHENLFPSSFSTAPVLDQVVKDICVEASTTNGGLNAMMAGGVARLASETSAPPSGSGGGSGGKVQYRLKPELYAEYLPTFVHLTRKQHEAAHENWFQQRLRLSKTKAQQQEDDSSLSTSSDATHSTWLDFPLVKNVLPCAPGFLSSRLAILHHHACKLVYETLWRAATDPHSSLNVLSRAVHLFTLQVYVVEGVRYSQSAPAAVDSEYDRVYLEQGEQLVNDYLSWVTSEQSSLYSVAEPRASVLQLVLKLNPWLPGNSSSSTINLDGDQKHELGRALDWLMHRLARLDPNCYAVVEQHRLTRRVSREEEDRKTLIAAKRREAQQRAILQMQQRQAAFAEQMKLMMAGGDNDEEDEDGSEMRDSVSANGGGDHEGDGTSTASTATAADVAMDDHEAMAVDAVDGSPLPECAMCHSTESENSFMCYVGFAQCSPVLSRVNNGLQGRFLCTPMDEMHVGEDVPVHVRLCGHSVHHTCWESYHASQFQRAITGGHHRHALNSVDVTKKEFLCPLCKSISNVLIPTTTDELNKLIHTKSNSGEPYKTYSEGDLFDWLAAIGQRDRHAEAARADDDGDERMAEELEQKPIRPLTPTPTELPPRVSAWLEDGLSTLCMAVHKVACGATQKSRPDRYSASGCLALFHTLLCTYLGSPDREQLRPEQRFLDAMQFLPLMLQQVTKPPRAINGTQSPPLSPRDRIAQLLYYGGSEILADGTVVLEEEHPSTQTQTRKQSQWGKVRWPTKPLLLSHLGSVLVKGILLADSEEEAVYCARLIVLAKLVQSLLWFSITRNEEYTDNMANELEISEETIEFFKLTLLEPANRSTASATQVLEQLRSDVLSHGGVTASIQGEAPSQLLNIVATEVVPMLKVATFLLSSRFRSIACAKPVFVTADDANQFNFIAIDRLQTQAMPLRDVVARWVTRFRAAYEEMNDTHGVLAQWFTSANADKAVPLQLDFARVLARDLNTVHTSMSVFASAANRTRYLRSLPRAYVKFYAALAKRKCAACHQFPARPAVCLVCGMLLCAASTCPSVHHDKGYPEESNPGACTIHARKCGRGSGLFLLVLEGAVLLVYWKLAAYVGSLYLDEYGEEFGERNRELNKGRPLYLNTERRDRLLRLWMHHEIPNEVVRIQNSSDRVIRNSHY